MIEQTFSINHLEYYLAIFVRVMGAIAFAPIFGNRTVTRRVRIFIGIACALAVFTANPYVPLEYSTFLGYTIILLKELIVGITIGFMSNVTLSIINAAGQFIDREIGFSMATTFDPMQGMVTITGDLYDKIVCLVIMISNLHYYILSAAAQSFVLVPVGDVVLNPQVVYTSMIDFIGQMFSIGFRIAMPVFLGATMLNVILGILAKSSPQMNMFAIGMQLKVFIGLVLLAICIMYVPNIANYIMERMRDMVNVVLGGL